MSWHTRALVVVSLVALLGALWWAASPEPARLAAPPEAAPPPLPPAPELRGASPTPTPPPTPAAPAPTGEGAPPAMGAEAPPRGPLDEPLFPRKAPGPSPEVRARLDEARAALAADNAEGALRTLKGIETFSVELETLRAEALLATGRRDEADRVLKKLYASGYEREARDAKKKLAGDR